MMVLAAALAWLLPATRREPARRAVAAAEA
jgi:hypothetical protein